MHDSAQDGVFTFCTFASPPSDPMPLSMFLIMQGCSTFTISWSGIWYHGAKRDGIDFMDFAVESSAIVVKESPIGLRSVSFH